MWKHESEMEIIQQMVRTLIWYDDCFVGRKPMHNIISIGVIDPQRWQAKERQVTCDGRWWIQAEKLSETQDYNFELSENIKLLIDNLWLYLTVETFISVMYESYITKKTIIVLSLRR